MQVSSSVSNGVGCSVGTDIDVKSVLFLFSVLTCHHWLSPVVPEY